MEPSDLRHVPDPLDHLEQNRTDPEAADLPRLRKSRREGTDKHYLEAPVELLGLPDA
jgi:hypothetical protein